MEGIICCRAMEISVAGDSSDDEIDINDVSGELEDEGLEPVVSFL